MKRLIASTIVAVLILLSSATSTAQDIVGVQVDPVTTSVTKIEITIEGSWLVMSEAFDHRNRIVSIELFQSSKTGSTTYNLTRELPAGEWRLMLWQMTNAVPTVIFQTNIPEKIGDPVTWATSLYLPIHQQ